MTFKSIRDNIVLLATTFSRKDKSSPNISPNTNLKIEHIRIFNKIHISLSKGLYEYVWVSLGQIYDGGGVIECLSIRDNIVLIATTFSRKDKSSPNISPNTF